jgi:beta-glucan synthesis-associated protein KRE6
VFGFEYWSDPRDPTSGYVEWVVDGTPSHCMGASAVGPDPEAQGSSEVGQKLILLELMSIVLNLGISRTPSLVSSILSLTIPWQIGRPPT